MSKLETALLDSLRVVTSCLKALLAGAPQTYLMEHAAAKADETIKAAETGGKWPPPGCCPRCIGKSSLPEWMQMGLLCSECFAEKFLIPLGAPKKERK